MKIKRGPSVFGVNQEISSGVAIIVVATIWFCAGLFVGGRIYLFPPVLFFIGVGTLIRGFSRSKEEP